jgi:hypothetical protein
VTSLLRRSRNRGLIIAVPTYGLTAQLSYTNLQRFLAYELSFLKVGEEKKISFGCGIVGHGGLS